MGGHLKKAILGLPWPIACANNVQGGCNVFDTFWDALFFFGYLILIPSVGLEG